MGLDFDVTEFLQNCRATKPPYDCPYEDCRKTYKSFQGISGHLYQQHTAGKGDSAGKKGTKARHDREVDSQSPSTSDNVITNTAREALTYAEAQRIIEVDIDGRLHRINISEPMNIVCFDGKNGFNGIKQSSLASDTCVIEEVVASSSKSDAKGKGSGKDNSEASGSRKSGNKLKGGSKSGKKGGPATPQASKTAVLPSPAPPVIKLPEPSFRVIDDYDPQDVGPRPTSYYRFIEKSPEELDESIEYDMDEEDFAWLELINKKRRDKKQTEVLADTFELLMDRLEKESYFLSQNSGKDFAPAIDDDALCVICCDGECQNSNAILFCDMCNLAVHQECYGVPYIPEGQWLCRRCLNSPSSAVDCVLCPNRGGAFKQTDDGKWAHVVCALWIPEVCFANTVFLEPIDSIGNIPQARWKLSCYICKTRNVGACIQCHKQNCYVAFHVTCAQQTGLFMKMEAVREMTPQGYQNVVRKAAYCHTHTPPDENGTSLSGVYASGDDEDSRSSMKRIAATNDAEFKEKIKKARKTLAEKRLSAPVVSIPTIPPERLHKIVEKITFQKRNEFILRLLGYWQLKRQSRNGVPLLRRLQISYMGSRRDESQMDDDEATVKLKEDLKSLQRLRQDLERARLLVEQIRKREKLKKEALKYFQMAVEHHLQPFKLFLSNVLSNLEAKDNQRIFAEPVDTDEVPDYLSFIKFPMDFSRMREKLNNNEYDSLDDFEADFELMISNCKSYNGDNLYAKAAEKLKNQGKTIIREAAVKAAKIGYNQRAGIHDPSDLGTDERRTNTIVEVRDEERRLRDRFTELSADLARVRMAKSGGSRSKKIKNLSAEISHVQREISLLNPTMFHDMDMGELPMSMPVIPATATVTSSPKKSTSTNSPSKQSTHSKAGTANGVVSDSEATDIIGELTPLKNFPPKGRRTMNSVSAAIEDSLSPKKSNSSGTGGTFSLDHSPSKSKTAKGRTPAKPKKKAESKKDTVANETKSTKKRARKAQSKNIVESSSEEEPPQDSPRSGIMADAATSTPAMPVFDKAEASNSKKGAKRKSNKGHGSSKSKKHATGDVLPQPESFRMYRNNNNSSSEDNHSESSHSSSHSSGSDSESNSESNSSSGSSSGSDEVSGDEDQKKNSD